MLKKISSRSPALDKQDGMMLLEGLIAILVFSCILYKYASPRD